MVLFIFLRKLTGLLSVFIQKGTKSARKRADAFLFYINDLPNSLVSNIRLFADDNVVYLTIHSATDTHVLQNDLDKLADWEKLWKMEFHPEKCEVLRVGRKCNLVQNDYVLHGKTLASVNSAKYLGVTI